MQTNSLGQKARTLYDEFNEYDAAYIAAVFAGDDAAAEHWRQLKLQTMARMLSQVVVPELSGQGE